MFRKISLLVMMTSIIFIIIIQLNPSQGKMKESPTSKKRAKSMSTQMEGSRALGYKKKGPKNATPGPKVELKWRPSEDTKKALARQKNIPESRVGEYATDPEFIYMWEDDYYDNYDFEHKRNMIQHGTFEAKLQNYYEAELKDAMEKLMGYVPAPEESLFTTSAPAPVENKA